MLITPFHTPWLLTEGGYFSTPHQGFTCVQLLYSCLHNESGGSTLQLVSTILFTAYNGYFAVHCFSAHYDFARDCGLQTYQITTQN